MAVAMGVAMAVAVGRGVRVINTGGLVADGVTGGTGVMLGCPAVAVGCTAGGCDVAVACRVGCCVGYHVGCCVGCCAGCRVGCDVGCDVEPGWVVQVGVGCCVGRGDVGEPDGWVSVGAAVATVGTRVGAVAVDSTVGTAGSVAPASAASGTAIGISTRVSAGLFVGISAG